MSDYPISEVKGADEVCWLIAIIAPTVAIVAGVLAAIAWVNFVRPHGSASALEAGIPFVVLTLLGCAISAGFMITSIKRREEKMVLSLVGGIPSVLWIAYVAQAFLR